MFSSGRQDSEELRGIAMERLRKNKEILKDAAFKRKFKRKFEGHQDIMFDLFEGLL